MYRPVCEINNMNIVMLRKSLWKAHYWDGYEEPIPFVTAFFIRGIRKLDQMGNTVELAERYE